MSRSDVDAEQILEALGSGVLLVRADGRVMYVNPRGTTILHRPVSGIVGRQVDTVLAPLATLLAQIGDGSRDEGARGELAVRLDDGHETHLGFSVSAFEAATSGVPHYVVLFQGISALLDLRRERDRLLQMAAIGDALPAVLHELRNPLAAITALLELMVEEAPDPMKLDVYAVLREVRRMTLGFDGIGSFARPLHARNHEAIDHAVREACRVLEASAARKGVRLIATGPDLPLLKVNRGVVTGVVLNLVKNAIDACDDGDEIAVDVRLEEPEMLVLRVRDSGRGMTPEVLERCCELFFTKKDTGSGIGLSICKQIAESSGGELCIDSTVGEGTTVWMRVPLGEPHPRGKGGDQHVTR